jgi:mono/diheme cytochrome c family protein
VKPGPKWPWILGALLVLSLAFLGWQSQREWRVPDEAKALRNPLQLTASAQADGKMLYEHKCAKCHGGEGKGDGPEAGMYSVRPADFTDRARMGSATDGELFYKITEGRRPMPSYRNSLTTEERWKLVIYIRSLAGP